MKRFRHIPERNACRIFASDTTMLRKSCPTKFIQVLFDCKIKMIYAVAFFTLMATSPRLLLLVSKITASPSCTGE